jgi:subtilisin family serine protease
MRSKSNKLRAILGSVLAGLLLIAALIGGSLTASSAVRTPTPTIHIPSIRVITPPGALANGASVAGSRRLPAGTGGNHKFIGRRIGNTQCEGGGGRGRFNHCDVHIYHNFPAPLGGAVSTGTGNGVGVGATNNNGRTAFPPPGEQRFVPDEVIVAFSAGTSPQAIAQLATRQNLTQLESQSFPLIGATLYRWHIDGGRSVVDTIGALGNEGVVASVQPNYLFALQQDSHNSDQAQGDAAQYVLSKLHIDQAHQIATGQNVLVAVIDSEIDAKHPDLNGAVVKSFDALGAESSAQEHGTEMAGAIASHGKLLGIAPRAELLAARAFDDSAGQAHGTSYAIYKSLQWAADNGARVINMSFVGPADPTMHRLLEAAYGKDMVLVAAAGNAGPNAAPLFPAADPSVIAVTATDSHDDLFSGANRGQYIAVAAPGVQILADAPGDSYQLSTGTSIAAAHVSGVAALLLQHDPALTPADIRNILMTTAKPLGLAGQHTDFGAGLVNAYRAITAPEAKSIGKASEPDPEQAKQ